MYKRQITDIQNPLTTYGKSKLLAERYIEEHYHNPFVIIKPTSVYGPRDKDFLIVMKLISKGFEGYIGTEPQKLSFIYVDDLVNAIISTIEMCIRDSLYTMKLFDAGVFVNPVIPPAVKEGHSLIRFFYDGYPSK